MKVNIERRRRAEATEEWRKRYDIRAGIEGAVGCGLPST